MIDFALLLLKVGRFLCLRHEVKEMFAYIINICYYGFGISAPPRIPYCYYGGLQFGALAQLARAPALQAGGQEFESLMLHQIMKNDP